MYCIIVVMGVSEAGKTTIGRHLADALQCTFQESDEFHPPSNIETMRASTPLTDMDRAPWLAAIERWIDLQLNARKSAVITCSALKRSYRAQLLRGRENRMCLLYLRAGESLLAERLRHRSGHFMPASLLHSQFEALEEPVNEAAVRVIEIDRLSIEQIAQKALASIEEKCAVLLQ